MGGEVVRNGTGRINAVSLIDFEMRPPDLIRPENERLEIFKAIQRLLIFSFASRGTRDGTVNRYAFKP